MIGKRGDTIKSWQLTMNAVSQSGAIIKNGWRPSSRTGVSNEISFVTVVGIKGAGRSFMKRKGITASQVLQPSLVIPN